MRATATTRLAAAFHVAAAELGMCSAAWLFVREVAASGGDRAVEELRDGLGNDYTVLECVARQWLGGVRAPVFRREGILTLCAGARHVVVTGLETLLLEALLALDESVEIWLVRHSVLEVDWDRVLANFGGRVRGIDLDDFQARAGRRSVLIASAYGTREHVTHVNACSLRVLGQDVRTQFRAVVAWEVLGVRMHLYPRWLGDVPLTVFSDLV